MSETKQQQAKLSKSERGAKMHISRLLSAFTFQELSSPRLSVLLTLLLGALNTVAGHTVFTNLLIDGIDQGDATCVRMPMTPHNSTFPITDLSSADMACGFDGTTGVARVCPVPSSSNLAFQFRKYPNDPQSGGIDSSHLGPCAVYMKRVTSAISDPGVGDGWFKLASSGYDSEHKKWCTQKLIEQNGLLDLGVKIPVSLAGGYYLVRPEILSLHDADKSPPQPQFYTGCAQVFVASEGTMVPRDTVSIPGYVGIGDHAVLFDVWNPVWPYVEAGPEVYVPGKSPGREVKSVQRQYEGLLPGTARIVNANWWGVELDGYGDEEGCWNASSSCYDQADRCYKSAPPTGSKNCKVWESRCSSIQGACKGGIFSGPPMFSYPANLLPSTTLSSTKSGEITTTSLASPPVASGTTNVETPTSLTTIASILYQQPTASKGQQDQTTQSCQDTMVGIASLSLISGPSFTDTIRRYPVTQMPVYSIMTTGSLNQASSDSSTIEATSSSQMASSTFQPAESTAAVSVTTDPASSTPRTVTSTSTIFADVRETSTVMVTTTISITEAATSCETGKVMTLGKTWRA